MIRGRLCTLALLLCASAVPTAQTPSQPPTFRSSTSLVEVDVVVKDKDGRFVSGLTADDFEVLEDGRPQRIQHFYLVTERPAAITEPLADVVLPRAPDQTGRRVFLFMFDSEHLSAMALARLKQSAMDFVNDQLRRGDLAGVFTNGALVRNRLTNVRQELLDAIRSAATAFESPETRMRALREFPRIDSEFEAIQIERADKTTLADAAAATAPSPRRSARTRADASSSRTRSTGSRGSTSPTRGGRRRRRPTR